MNSYRDLALHCVLLTTVFIFIIIYDDDGYFKNNIVKITLLNCYTTADSVRLHTTESLTMIIFTLNRQ